MSFISIMNNLKEKKELLLLSNNSPPLKYNIIVSPIYNKFPNLKFGTIIDLVYKSPSNYSFFYNSSYSLVDSLDPKYYTVVSLFNPTVTNVSNSSPLTSKNESIPKSKLSQKQILIFCKTFPDLIPYLNFISNKKPTYIQNNRFLTLYIIDPLASLEEDFIYKTSISSFQFSTIEK